MEEVELDHVAAALVGTDETGGLSFEQKKRLSIAVELAASPSIIFLDEVSTLTVISHRLMLVMYSRVFESFTCVVFSRQGTGAGSSAFWPLYSEYSPMHANSVDPLIFIQWFGWTKCAARGQGITEDSGQRPHYLCHHTSAI